MHLLELIFFLIVVFFLVYTFHKTRRVHLMLYQIQNQMKKLSTKTLDNLFHQIEALQGLYLDLSFKKSLPPTRGWAASPDFLCHLSSHVLCKQPKVIVECGSGVSTLILARCMELNGMGHVYSLEHLPEYVQKTREHLNRHGLSKWATVLDAPLRTYELKGEEWPWYSMEKCLI